jgi:polyphosphate kinase 2 (PPK2 family)
MTFAGTLATFRSGFTRRTAGRCSCGMDAAGKDSAIKGIFEGVNPQGCEVTSFKQPNNLELNHDFMWCTMVALPGRGRIGIFNRSYYEECLVTRVHTEFLAQEKIPRNLITRNIWRERFADISAIELGRAIKATYWHY